MFDAASTETEYTDFIDFGYDDELLEQIMTHVHSLKKFYVQGEEEEIPFQGDMSSVSKTSISSLITSEDLGGMREKNIKSAEIEEAEQDIETVEEDIQLNIQKFNDILTDEKKKKEQEQEKKIIEITTF